MIRNLSLVALLFACAAVSPASATTWYVNSATGNDNNDGKTLGSPFATLQKAANSTVAGDKVYVLPGNGYGGGTSGTAPLIISTSGSGAGTGPGGTCSAPITYSAYPGTRPIISGTRAQGTIMGVYPISCIVVNGFEIAGWNGSLTWAGVSANAAASGTSWQNVNYNADGIFFGGGVSGKIPHHIVITNNYVHDFPEDGIGVTYGDYTTVSGNTATGNALYSPFSGSGISLYEFHNIDSGTATKNVVSGNVSFGNRNLVFDRAAQLVTLTTSAPTASGSNTLNFTSYGAANYTMSVIDGANGCIPPGTIVYYFSGSNIVMNSNTTCGIASGTTITLGYITDGGGIIIDNNGNTQSDNIAYVGRTLITDNIVYNNGAYGIACAPSSNNCDITFNTLYQNDSSPGILGNTAYGGEANVLGSQNSNVYNNIFYVLAGNQLAPGAMGSGSSWGNNLYYGSQTQGTLAGTNNVLGNPLFVSPGTNPHTTDFQLEPGSPAIDAGSSAFTRALDYDGSPGLAGAGYDIGAYEQPSCSTFGVATVRSPAALMSEFADGTGAGAITKQSIRDLIVSLSCGQAKYWGQ